MTATAKAEPDTRPRASLETTEEDRRPRAMVEVDDHVGGSPAISRGGSRWVRSTTLGGASPFIQPLLERTPLDRDRDDYARPRSGLALDREMSFDIGHTLLHTEQSEPAMVARYDLCCRKPPSIVFHRDHHPPGVRRTSTLTCTPPHPGISADSPQLLVWLVLITGGRTWIRTTDPLLVRHPTRPVTDYHYLSKEQDGPFLIALYAHQRSLQ